MSAGTGAPRGRMGTKDRPGSNLNSNSTTPTWRGLPQNLALNAWSYFQGQGQVQGQASSRRISPSVTNHLNPSPTSNMTRTPSRQGQTQTQARACTHNKGCNGTITGALSNLISIGKSALSVSSHPEDPVRPCPECAAAALHTQKGRTTSYSSTSGRSVLSTNSHSSRNRGEDSESLHKGYKLIHHPRDPTAPPPHDDSSPDSNSDPESLTHRRGKGRTEEERIADVIALSSDESFSGCGSDDGSTSSEDSGKSNRIKERGFKAVGSRDLSPLSKERRRKRNKEIKEANRGLDDLAAEFKPTWSMSRSSSSNKAGSGDGDGEDL